MSHAIHTRRPGAPLFGRAATFVSALAAALAVAAASAIPAIAEAAVLPVHGVLRSDAGGPVADGTYIFFVSLYDVVDAKEPVWTAPLKNVPVQSGFFAVELGGADTPALPDGLFTGGGPLWLGVQVGGEPELPRRSLVVAPFAIHAQVAASAAFPWAAAKTAGGAATGLECVGCVDGLQIANASIDNKKIAFTYAASDGKGGKAKVAEFAELAAEASHATLADEAAFAQNANSAAKSTTADEALGLQCTGCVSLVALADSTKAAFVSSSGGKVSGDLEVGGKMTVASELALGKSPISGGRFQALDTTAAPCDASVMGQVTIDTGNKRLYFCDGSVWQRLTVCTEVCPPASTVECGKPLANACGDAGSCAGSGSMCPDGQSCTAKGCATPGSQQWPAKNCDALHATAPGAKDGSYWIDPDGDGGLDAFQVTCDMSTAGGGWTGIEETTDFAYQVWSETDSTKPYIYKLTKAQIDAVKLVSKEARQDWACKTNGVIQNNTQVNWIVFWNGETGAFNQCQDPANNSVKTASGTWTALAQLPMKEWHPEDCGDGGESCQHNVGDCWMR